MKSEKLDVSKLSPDVDKLQSALLSKIIGQERAVKQVINGYIPMTVNMHREGKPLGVYLFLGPTGVGKSETVKQVARFLLGKSTALTKIDCTEFKESHEVAKLLGAPPGYIGHDRNPRLSQDKIDQYQTAEHKVNVILFDEIEKADDHLFDVIMSILGDGTLTLGNSSTVDFSRSFVFLTSNLGSHEIRKLLRGEGMGFQKMEKTIDDMDDAIYRVSKKAAEKKWRPEFINRIDKIVVFRPLTEVSLRIILNNELKELQWRIRQSPFKGWNVDSKEPQPERRDIKFQVSAAAKSFLLKEGTSEIYGARELNRAIDRFVAIPLASLISSGQLVHGDNVRIDHVEGATELEFNKEKLVQ